MQISWDFFIYCTFLKRYVVNWVSFRLGIAKFESEAPNMNKFKNKALGISTPDAFLDIKPTTLQA